MFDRNVGYKNDLKKIIYRSNKSSKLENKF